jgi:hypothetical protein
MIRAQANQRQPMRQLIVWALLLPAVGLAGGQVVDRSVAMVNSQVVTLSELDFEARVLLIYAGGVEAATAELDMAVLKDSLEEIISHRLLSAEAEALGAYPLEDGEIEAALKRFKGRFQTQGEWQAFLDRHEAEEASVVVALQRLLRAQRVLDGKLRLKAQVSEAEARRYVAEHDELSAMPLSAVRQKLYADRFKTLARAEVKQARKNAKVRLLGPFSVGYDGGSP